MCPKKVFEKYFSIMNFTKMDGENYLNCRVEIKNGRQVAKPKEALGYTTSLENTKSLLDKLGIEGKFLEK